MKHISLITIALRLFGVIASGTVFFRLVEGWSWVDSYFFTVITISTVGYGHPIPESDLGKIGSTLLIFAGFGVFAVSVQQIAIERLEKGDRNPGRLHRFLKRWQQNREKRDNRQNASNTEKNQDE